MASKPWPGSSASAAGWALQPRRQQPPQQAPSPPPLLLEGGLRAAVGSIILQVAVVIVGAAVRPARGRPGTLSQRRISRRQLPAGARRRQGRRGRSRGQTAITAAPAPQHSPGLPLSWQPRGVSCLVAEGMPNIGWCRRCRRRRRCCCCGCSCACCSGGCCSCCMPERAATPRPAGAQVQLPPRVHATSCLLLRPAGASGVVLLPGGRRRCRPVRAGGRQPRGRAALPPVLAAAMPQPEAPLHAAGVVGQPHNGGRGMAQGGPLRQHRVASRSRLAAPQSAAGRSCGGAARAPACRRSEQRVLPGHGRIGGGRAVARNLGRRGCCVGVAAGAPPPGRAPRRAPPLDPCPRVVAAAGLLAAACFVRCTARGKACARISW
jgi:hypothetical protein